MNRRPATAYVLGQALSLMVTAVVLFGAAGRVDWPAAWVVVAVWLIWFAAMDVAVLRFNPGLASERLAPPKGAKRWDRAIVSVIRLLELARYVLAGLDLRYGWTTGFPGAAQVAAIGVWLLATAVFAWAVASNPFFSQVVRIQTDRDHTVATGGPYRYVRHPGYVGAIAAEVAISTALGSWPAILAGAVCALLLVVRTALEDRTLHAELQGYADYARRVRYRLLPGVW